MNVSSTVRVVILPRQRGTDVAGAVTQVVLTVGAGSHVDSAMLVAG